MAIIKAIQKDKQLMPVRLTASRLSKVLPIKEILSFLISFLVVRRIEIMFCFNRFTDEHFQFNKSFEFIRLKCRY